MNTRPKADTLFVMGEIPTYEYDDGNNCDRCFGIGKTFGDVKTPKTVKAVFSGITVCPGGLPNPNGSYLLTQGGPCNWSFIDAKWDCQFKISVADNGGFIAELGLSGFQIILAWYFGATNTECSITFTNNYAVGDCPVVLGGYGGTAEISWGPEIK